MGNGFILALLKTRLAEFFFHGKNRTLKTQGFNSTQVNITYLVCVSETPHLVTLQEPHFPSNKSRYRVCLTDTIILIDIIIPVTLT